MVTQQLQDLALLQSVFLRSVGADHNIVANRQLPCYPDSDNLVLAAKSQGGREYLLEPAAAKAWVAMHAAAVSDDISLIMISAFRSFSYQADLIRRKVSFGQSVNEVLAILAPPGCSEHHTGMACDIGTMGCAPAEEEFENTAAFEWLQANAINFGFSLSFPRDNGFGYIYEPWHWRFSASPLREG
jgi:D-alanyl-D-alanine carboxypeptidase